MMLPPYRIARAWRSRDGYAQPLFIDEACRHGKIDFYQLPGSRAALMYCTICGKRRDR
jgi:hypothetical protein